MQSQLSPGCSAVSRNSVFSPCSKGMGNYTNSKSSFPWLSLRLEGESALTRVLGVVGPGVSGGVDPSPHTPVPQWPVGLEGAAWPQGSAQANFSVHSGLFSVN